MRPNLPHFWYQSSLHPFLFLLLPFAWIFGLIIFLRRFCYKIGLFKQYKSSVPVIVVGNITVGGTGKTPFVLWLIQVLRAQGFNPGIVTRGVGGKKYKQPHVVTVQDDAKEVGDEAVLLVRHCQCPLVIGVNRVLATQKLLTHSPDCNVVICDDGLQHYQLNRDGEIVIIDGERQFGNGYLLPAGPLREPVSRLQTVDCVVVNGSDMQYQTKNLINLVTKKNIALAEFLTEFPNEKVHAVAGIGNPGRFFRELQQLGFTIIPHDFPDHYPFTKKDFDFKDDLPIIMTEKDAVKCQSFADERYWYLPINVKISNELESKIKTMLMKV